MVRLAVLLAATTVCSCGDSDQDDVIDVAVFTKTVGYRHASIPDCIAMLEAHAAARGWRLTATEDGAALAASLSDTDAVVFCNTSEDVLSDSEQITFEAFIRAGGGFVGIHSAADTEYGWPFYGQLVGAWFASHPAIQTATMHVETTAHPATAHLPPQLSLEEELYNFRRNPRGDVTVLATVDEASYSGGEMGSDHPIMWHHEVDRGRAFYVGLGHIPATYARDDFRQLVAAAVEWAAAP